MAKLSAARESEITISLLTAVERDATASQRRLASELGVAVGLVNLYLRRCIRKGLVKVAEIPSRRYAYYLTPHGFSEKTRLTLEYMSISASFFRQAREDFGAAFQEARARGWTRVGLVGVSEVAELAVISALERDVPLVCVLGTQMDGDRFVGLPVDCSISNVALKVDGVIATDLRPTPTLQMALDVLGEERVILPGLMRASYELRAASVAE